MNVHRFSTWATLLSLVAWIGMAENLCFAQVGARIGGSGLRDSQSGGLRAGTGNVDTSGNGDRANFRDDVGRRALRPGGLDAGGDRRMGTGARGTREAQFRDSDRNGGLDRRDRSSDRFGDDNVDTRDLDRRDLSRARFGDDDIDPNGEPLSRRTIRRREADLRERRRDFARDIAEVDRGGFDDRASNHVEDRIRDDGSIRSGVRYSDSNDRFLGDDRSDEPLRDELFREERILDSRDMLPAGDRRRTSGTPTRTASRAADRMRSFDDVTGSREYRRPGQIRAEERDRAGNRPDERDFRGDDRNVSRTDLGIQRSPERYDSLGVPNSGRVPVDATRYPVDEYWDEGGLEPGPDRASRGVRTTRRASRDFEGYGDDLYYYDEEYRADRDMNGDRR